MSLFVAAIIETARSWFFSRISTNCLPRSFSGVTRMTIPYLMYKSGIQWGKDFPEPVTAIVMTSLPSRTIQTTSICHIHGHVPVLSSTSLWISSLLLGIVCSLGFDLMGIFKASISVTSGEIKILVALWVTSGSTFVPRNQTRPSYHYNFWQSPRKIVKKLRFGMKHMMGT